MSDVQVKFKRGDTATLNSTSITDGLIYFNTENKRIYMDNDTDRLEYANDMSNFMQASTIESLVDKNSAILKNPQDITKVIGGSYIGDEAIIPTTEGLYNNKALFQLVWEDTDPQPCGEKTIVTNGIYPFYFILFGDFDFTNGQFLRNARDSYIDKVYGMTIVNSESMYGYNSNNYAIVLNNTTVYSDFGYIDTLSVNQNYGTNKVGTRRIQITADNENNTTTFNFGAFGVYYNGEWNHSGIINEYDSNTNYTIPFKIIGIMNT